MFNPTTPVEWIITKETLERELQEQSALYFARRKKIWTKDEFIKRIGETIDKLNAEIEKSREENDLELVTKYEEALKSNNKQLELLDFEMEQNQKDCDWAVEVVLYIKELLKWMK